MELTILTRFQLGESMLKALSRVNTIVLVLTYASLICNVLVQQCLTKVIGTLPVLLWALNEASAFRDGVAVPASNLQEQRLRLAERVR